MRSSPSTRSTRRRDRSALNQSKRARSAQSWESLKASGNPVYEAAREFANGFPDKIPAKLPADRGTERVNRIPEDPLRSYATSFAGWNSFLPLTDFALNNAEHASTGLTLFFANNARHPHELHESPRNRYAVGQTPPTNFHDKGPLLNIEERSLRPTSIMYMSVAISMLEALHYGRTYHTSVGDVLLSVYHPMWSFAVRCL
ncbi:hypothetical protein PR003_g17325 [Phytophthora rubi]|uniref:Uncharacterized protein n=1 Tax=Phytophthora rubi TaxID=129364 RepID=A0A6A4EFA1_9STRA|nr:hypothetical protein PR001_g15693 [Phytophthora rubi]KAE9322065.1 hypothetical protein PR003_g17325 [Phytophthora rubi]